MSDDALTGLRLLVVEDDAMVRDVVVRTARGWGLHVDQADGGTPAKTLLADNDYDVVISDLKMPDVSGLEVLESARACCPHAALILITGFADDGVEELVKGSGGLLVHKPFNMERLRDALGWAKERLQEPHGSG
ncbi:MAG: response regulator [Acidobacteriota bacterium]|jgi:DNA-binding response OmpR family regulator